MKFASLLALAPLLAFASPALEPAAPSRAQAPSRVAAAPSPTPAARISITAASIDRVGRGPLEATLRLAGPDAPRVKGAKLDIHEEGRTVGAAQFTGFEKVTVFRFLAPVQATRGKVEITFHDLHGKRTGSGAGSLPAVGQRELVGLHIGQAGVQVGSQCWEGLCREGRSVVTVTVPGHEAGRPRLVAADGREFVYLGGSRQYESRARFRPRDKGYKAKSGIVVVNLYQSSNNADKPMATGSAAAAATAEPSLSAGDSKLADSGGNDLAKAKSRRVTFTFLK